MESNRSLISQLQIYTLSGGISGVCVDLVLFPLDSIKTRLQATSNKTDYVKKAQSISKYKGLQSSMMASFPCAAVFWTTYEISKQVFNFLPIYMIPSISAAIAETVQGLVRNPFEVIKTNMQIGQHSSMQDSIINIYKKEGLNGFYRGYFSLIFRDIPFGAVQYSFYESIKKIGPFKDFGEDISNGLNGSLAGALGGLTLTPLDVIKTKQQIIINQQQSLLTISKQLYNEEGFQGFFKGGSMRTMYLFFGGFAFFGIYEKCKSNFQRIL